MKRAIVRFYNMPWSARIVGVSALVLSVIVVLGVSNLLHRPTALPPDGRYYVRNVTVDEPYVLDPKGSAEIEYLNRNHGLAKIRLADFEIREGAESLMDIESQGATLYLKPDVVVTTWDPTRRLLWILVLTAISFAVIFLILMANLGYFAGEWDRR